MAEARRGGMTLNEVVELFADDDSDTEEDFLRNFGNDSEDIEDDPDLDEAVAELNNMPAVAENAYSHQWLRDFDKQTGSLIHDQNSSEYDIFSHYYDDDYISMLVTETNRYADQYFAYIGDNLRPHARARKWVPVEHDEMKAFIAIFILMGLDRRSNYELYWTVDGYLEMPGFRSLMSRDRFLLILQFFHLADNTKALPRDHDNFDRLFKIRSAMNHLIPLWQSAYYPNRELSVDESIIPFKGRSFFIQYMPNKPHKWGLNAWVLADSRTGYTWNWNLYAGKERGAAPEHGLTHRVVMDITRPIHNAGHHVYMDNLFTSPVLFDDLASKDTGACGTLRVNRRGTPDDIKNVQRTLKKEDPPKFVTSGNKLFIAWKDKRVVNVLTTVHNDAMFVKNVRDRNQENHIRQVNKPAAIELYTQFMGGVDRADQNMWYFLTLHRTVKWWKKAFLALQEACLVNTQIIYRELQGNKKIPPQRMRLNIVQGLLAQYVRRQHIPRHPAQVPSRLTERHFVGINANKTNKGRQSFPDCVVCSDRKVKRHQTEYVCRQCRAPMCPYPCFERYHTLVNFKVSCSKELHKF